MNEFTVRIQVTPPNGSTMARVRVLTPDGRQVFDAYADDCQKVTVGDLVVAVMEQSTKHLVSGLKR